MINCCQMSVFLLHSEKCVETECRQTLVSRYIVRM